MKLVQLLVHVPQFRVSYQTRIQRSWSTGRTILLKDKSQSRPTSRSCLRVWHFFCCKFIVPLQATLFPPLIPAVVGLKRAARWTGRQWSSFYQMTFFNAYCVLQENCRNMLQWHLASLLPPLPPMKWKLTLRSSGMIDIKVHWNIYIYIYIFYQTTCHLSSNMIWESSLTLWQDTRTCGGMWYVTWTWHTFSWHTYAHVDVFCCSLLLLILSCPATHYSSKTRLCCQTCLCFSENLATLHLKRSDDVGLY